MNSVTLIGNLTRDPEAAKTTTGTDVCRLRLAVPRRPKDGRDQAAVFVDVVAYGNRAVAVATHLTKGRQVGVSGRLEFREWTGADGNRHSMHEVIAERIDFLGHPNGTSSRTAGDPAC